MKFINDTQHGIIDYLVAVGLVAGPFAFKLQMAAPLAHWLSIAAGAGLFFYSLLTSYSVGLRKAISFKTHLYLDFTAGIIFIVTPLVCGFEGTARAYYLLIGIAIIAVVMATDSNTATKNQDSRQNR